MYRHNPDDQIILQLRKLLADTYVTYTQLQGAHWNVVGSDFQQLHTLFQTQYEELLAAIDVIAEHIRAYDELSPGSLQEMLQLSDVGEISFLQGEMPSEQLVSLLIRSHETVLAAARRLADISEHEWHTNDLAAQRMAAHTTHIWMLRSSNKRVGATRRSLRRRNPWDAGDVGRHNKKCASRAACRRKWPRIANAVLRDSGDKGKAIRIANWQTKRMGLYPRRNPW